MTNVRGAMTALILSVIGIAPSAGGDDAAGSAQPDPGPQASTPATAEGTGSASATYAWPSTAWHLFGGLGLGAADGKYGDFLQKPVQWELRIAQESSSGAWRFGGGLQFGSMNAAEDP